MPLDPDRVAIRLKIVLENYNQAKVRGDFLETVFAIHTAIEDASIIKMGLEDHTESPSFNKTFEDAFPGIFSSHNVKELNKLRRKLAHPRQPFRSREIYDLAREFVDVALVVWPEVFPGSPPKIQYPMLSKDIDQQKVARLLDQKDDQIGWLQNSLNDLQNQVSDYRERISSGHLRPSEAFPWRLSLIAVLLVLVVIFLVGLTTALYDLVGDRWYLWLLSALVSCGVGYFALKKTIQFFREVKIRRLFVLAAIVIVLATILFAPFAPNSLQWNEKAGHSLSQVLLIAVQTPTRAVKSIYSWGESIPGIFSQDNFPQIAETQPDEEVEKETEIQPKTTYTQPNSSSETTENSTTDELTAKKEMVSGASVVVKTDGSRLMCRENPGITNTIVARFENGEHLTLGDGPEEIDDLSWWQAKKDDVSCWCVSDYLILE